MAGFITELKSTIKNRDVWILAAGPSLSYIEPSFFDGKFTIGVNYVWQLFNVDFVVVKESFALRAALLAGQKVIGSRYHCGSYNGYLNEITDLPGADWWVFDHKNNGLEAVDLTVIDLESDQIVVSYSTFTSALHVAAFMGAKNIIIVGHDCGSLDGELNVSGYPVEGIRKKDPAHYGRFLSSIEDQSIKVRDRIAQIYGCNIYSLNPFVNFGLEGHIYKRTV